MAFIQTEDLSFALKALKEKEGLRPISCRKSKTQYRILCCDERAFRITLILENADATQERESVWNSFFLSSDRLVWNDEEGSFTVGFTAHFCEITLKDHAFAPYSFAPGHYIRTGWQVLLSSLAEKRRLLNNFLSPEEKELSPLFDCDPFSELTQEQKELLIRFGQTEFPLRENPMSANTLEHLRKFLTDEGETLPLPEEVTRVFGCTAENPQFRLETQIKKRTVSVGLKTQTLIRKKIFCVGDLRFREENLVLRCSVSDRSDFTSPLFCAAEGKGFCMFEVFCLNETECNEKTLSQILSYLMLSSDISVSAYALTQRPQLSVVAVYALSGLLWGMILSGLYRFGAFLSSLFGFSPPAAEGLILLCTVVYAFIRWSLYATSLKR